MNTQRSVRRIASTVAMAVLLSFGIVLADGGANHQVFQPAPVKLGTSGGNVNDRSNSFCCSGTLGALVERGGTRYILSNNHVMGLSGSAGVGDNISQPGLIDVGCNVNNTQTVANFTEAPALGSANVDAALAAANSAVDATGAILDIGQPSSSAAAASLGLEVAKSGRTTGLTCGTVSSINTDVSVRYQAGCGSGKKFTITFTDQVVVTGSSFSAGGDSGSLILTQAGVQPVALLFAGSSSSTIGNPIQDVSAALGGISVVGNGTGTVTCPSGGGGGGGGKPGKGPKRGTSVEKARAAKEQHARSLMQDDAVLGVGVGMDDDGEAVVMVYVEQGRAHKVVPETMNGVRTVIIRTDPFRAYGWNEKLLSAGACKTR